MKKKLSEHNNRLQKSITKLLDKNMTLKNSLGKEMDKNKRVESTKQDVKQEVKENVKQEVKEEVIKNNTPSDFSVPNMNPNAIPPSMNPNDAIIAHLEMLEEERRNQIKKIQSEKDDLREETITLQITE